MENLLSKIEKYFSKLYLFFLVILGASMLSFLIWNKFIRVRLPKEIPLNLSHAGLIILIYICLIYLIIIITLLIKVETNSGITKAISDFIYKPLTTFDSVLKNTKFIHPIYELVLNRAILYYSDYIMKQRYNNRTRANINMYIIFRLMPRAIMASALAVDVFYLHCLFLVYKVVYVYILILLIRYLKYSFKYAKEQYILRLEETVAYIITDHHIPEDESIPASRSLRLFVDIQTCAFVYDDKLHSCEPRYYNNKDIKNLNKEFNILMPKIIAMSVFLEEYDNCDHLYSRLRKAKVAIYSLYLICWLSILVMSLKTYDYTPLIDNLPKIVINPPMEDPFAGLFTCSMQ